MGYSEFHQFVAVRRKAAEYDDRAAAGYDRLAAVATEPEWRLHWAGRAAEARESAAANRRAAQDRTNKPGRKRI